MADTWTINVRNDFSGLLGGKGAGLVKMHQLGLRVPPAFIVHVPASHKFREEGHDFIAKELWNEVVTRLAELESTTHKRFGNPRHPLLLAIRSGAPIGMPGMMDTVLNVGMTDLTRPGLVSRTGNENFSWECYNHFLKMLGKTVLGLQDKQFEAAKASVGSGTPEALISAYKQIVGAAAKNTCYPDILDNVEQQLMACIEGVFKSWDSERAVRYRKMFKISDTLGTAVVVQAMVFGNIDAKSGTGVVFTRNPATGDNEPVGEYLQVRQGDEIVGGEMTSKSQPISALAKTMPEVYSELIRGCRLLEYATRDIQDIEFTFEQGCLCFLQTRSAKRTSFAAIQFLIDMVKQGLISEEDARRRTQNIPKTALQQWMLRETVKDKEGENEVFVQGSGIIPRVASGRLAFSPQEAQKIASKGQKAIMVRLSTRPEDIAGIETAEGLFTAGGTTVSHAAIVCLELNKPCVVNTGVQIDLDKGIITSPDGTTLSRGDLVTIDGATGVVFTGAPQVIKTMETDPELLSWAQKILSTGDRRLY